MSLWLACYFPRLPLEVFSPGLAPQQPLAVVDGPRLLLTNDAASAAGIHPGQTPAAAYALAHNLILTPRSPAEEQAALDALALWAYQFSSQVSLAKQGLVLEISGSLRLFGGLSRLIAEISRQLATLSHTHGQAVAPTPRAALLLARGQARPGAAPLPAIQEQAQLTRVLRHYPVSLLDLPAATAKLHSVGIRRLGQCLDLPRPELARRCGQELLDTLDKLLGARPDPWPRFTPPENFERHLSLPAETANAEALVFACRRLLGELATYLRVRVKGVQELAVQLFHREPPVTQFTVSLQGPSGDPSYLLELLREHLQRLTLPAPVQALRLHAPILFTLSAQAGDLFSPAQPALSSAALADRLSARLGKDSIHSLQTLADHRPERSWQTCPPGQASPAQAAREPRPLWLLSAPLALATRRNQPFHQGPLQLLSPMERIETGWWDDGAVARDYYLASNPGGSVLWIYRERGSGRWFLHGVFA